MECSLKKITMAEQKSILKKDKDLKFPHIFQLSASAGSGKTENLSLRYIQFNLSDKIRNNYIDNIVAITFTNKAANEMKDRVLKLLKKTAIEDSETTDKVKDIIDAENSDETLYICKGGTKLLQTAESQTADSKNTDSQNESRQTIVSQNASSIVDNIIKNWTDFNIKTIDSFLTDILSASLRETDIGPNFKIVTNVQPYIEFAIDELLLKVNSDSQIKELFLDFIENYLVIENKKSFNPRSAIIDIVKDLRDKENTNGKRFYNKDINIYQVKQRIAQNKVNLSKGIDNIEKKLPALISFNKNFQNALKQEKINNYEFKSAYWQKKNLKDILKGISKNNIDIIQPQLEFLQREWDKIRLVLEDIINDVGSIRFYSYIKILDAIRKILAEQARKEGVVFIDELKSRVKSLIKNRVPEIYFNIGEQIYHYLIDEFQDTDRLQWEIIEDLVLNSLSNGGSLFYVGDKKQSIYRFKGSDVKLFEEIIDNDSKDNDSKDYEFLNHKHSASLLSSVEAENIYREVLPVNFRSKDNLINFFNTTFTPANLKNIVPDDEEDGIKKAINQEIIYFIEETYKNHEQKSKINLLGNEAEKNAAGNNDLSADNNNLSNGYVYIERVSDNNLCGNQATREDADTNIKNIKSTINIINDLKPRYRLKDIAILVRTNEEARDLAVKLKKEGISVESEQSADIRYHPATGEVILFMKFLNRPDDNLSFATFITGDVFTTRTRLRKDEIYDWLLENKLSRYLYKDFQKWQEDIWNNYINDLFKSVGYLPAYDLVCLFYDRFNIYENFKDSIGFFMHLLELFKNREHEGENSLDMFLEFWEDKNQEYSQFLVRLNSSQDALKIFTIHKAKGLEFPVVIMPFASIENKNTNDNSKLIFNNNANNLKLIYTNKDYQNILLSIDENLNEVNKAYIKERAMSFLDEINLFYVAATRAKDELYILMPAKTSNKLQRLFFKDTDIIDNIKDEEKEKPVEIGAKFSSSKQGKRSGGESRKKAHGREEEPAESAPFYQLKNYDWKKHIYGISEKDEIKTLIDQNTQNQIKRGNIIHAVLSKFTIFNAAICIDRYSQLRHLIDEEIKSEEIEGIEGIDLKPDGIEEIENELIDILNIAEVKPWFFIDDNININIYTEKDIVNSDGELKRIDRLIITAEKAIVIDYKTGIINSVKADKYRKQLKNYMNIISQIYPDKSVEGYILYIDEKRVQKI